MPHELTPELLAMLDDGDRAELDRLVAMLGTGRHLECDRTYVLLRKLAEALLRLKWAQEARGPVYDAVCVTRDKAIAERDEAVRSLYVVTAKLTSTEAERDGLWARLADDALADRIARDCHDEGHHPAWCPTCNSRDSGIEAYRAVLRKEIEQS